MAAFAKSLPTLLTKTHVVLEVRDSRLPLTSINSRLESTLVKWKAGGGIRERIVVYTKTDITPSWGHERLRRALQKHFDHHTHFTSPSSFASVRALHSTLVSIAQKHAQEITALNVLVVGMPNVGKSTLLNSLRGAGTSSTKKNPLKTSSLPGLTQSLSNRLKLSNTHPIYAIDSPGVMIPFFGHGDSGRERGVKLALIAGIKESLYDDETLATYLAWRLWREQPSNPAYNILLGPSEKEGLVTDSSSSSPESFEPHVFLETLSKRIGAIQRGGEYDLERTARYFIQWWRDGKAMSSYRPVSSPSLTRNSSMQPATVRSWGLDFDFDSNVALTPLPTISPAPGEDPIQDKFDEEVAKFVDQMSNTPEAGMGMSATRMKKDIKAERLARSAEKRRAALEAAGKGHRPKSH